MSGPLVSDDGAKMIGSLFLIEAPGRSGGRSLQPRRSLRCRRYLGEGYDHRVHTPAGMNLLSVYMKPAAVRGRDHCSGRG
jgi:hypothetical protein